MKLIVFPQLQYRLHNIQYQIRMMKEVWVFIANLQILQKYIEQLSILSIHLQQLRTLFWEVDNSDINLLIKKTNKCIMLLDLLQPYLAKITKTMLQELVYFIFQTNLFNITICFNLNFLEFLNLKEIQHRCHFIKHHKEKAFKMLLVLHHFQNHKRIHLFNIRKKKKKNLNK